MMVVIRSVLLTHSLQGRKEGRGMEGENGIGARRCLLAVRHVFHARLCDTRRTIIAVWVKSL